MRINIERKCEIVMIHTFWEVAGDEIRKKKVRLSAEGNSES